MSCAEQATEQAHLRVAGVLVLVEQHGAVTFPLGANHLGHLGQLRRQRHLVAEVDGSQGALRSGVLAHERQQRQPVLQGRPQPPGIARRWRGAAVDRGQLVGDGLAVALDGIRLDEVVDELAGERQDVLRDRAERADATRQCARIAAHDRVRELPAHRLRQQPRIRLGAHAHRMLADQARGVRGIGEHGGFAGEQFGQVLGVGEPVALDDVAPARETPPDATPEFGRRLAGERQAEHGVRRHEPVGHQPDDAGRHRLGLAGAGAGDDDGRCRWRLDDRCLLVGGRGEARAAGPARPRKPAPVAAIHNVTCRPSGSSGQLDRTSQPPQ